MKVFIFFMYDSQLYLFFVSFCVFFFCVFVFVWEQRDDYRKSEQIKEKMRAC